nr:MAG TPA: TniQ [Bacteriophage sp.]
MGFTHIKYYQTMRCNIQIRNWCPQCLGKLLSFLWFWRALLN